MRDRLPILVAAFALIGIGALLCLTGCVRPGKTGSEIISAQAPASAYGAGASVVGPTNSAAPTTQKAKKTVVYQKAPASGRNKPVKDVYSAPGVSVQKEQENDSGAIPEPPTPVYWTQEETETVLGQHQDAAGIVKVAVEAQKWGKGRWIGIFCLLAAIGGLLYSHNNKEGYPVICWKVGAIGLSLTILDPHPAWLLLLLIPLGFYVAQKMNLLRLP